jgi:hypothetical protein
VEVEAVNETQARTKAMQARPSELEVEPHTMRADQVEKVEEVQS